MYVVGILGTFTACMTEHIISAMVAKAEPPERVITPMSKELIERIDDFRFANRLRSRAEATRQLIEAGLRAKAPKAQKPS
jgi:hypothetical protein